MSRGWSFKCLSLGVRRHNRGLLRGHLQDCPEGGGGGGGGGGGVSRVTYPGPQGIIGPHGPKLYCIMAKQ